MPLLIASPIWVLSNTSALIYRFLPFPGFCLSFTVFQISLIQMLLHSVYGVSFIIVLANGAIADGLATGWIEEN